MAPSLGSPKGLIRRIKTKVFALPLNPAKEYNAPGYPKSSSVKQFLLAALKKNFVFAHVFDKVEGRSSNKNQSSKKKSAGNRAGSGGSADSTTSSTSTGSVSAGEVTALIDAFECVEYKEADTVLIKKGDQGDYFYVVFSGSCSIFINEEKVGTSLPGDSFGELALLYTSPRAATVKTVEPSTKLYRLDHQTFRYILQAQMQKRQSEKRKLLLGLPFMKNLKEDELQTVLTAMTPARYSKGEYILRTGDAAVGMFIILEGAVRIENIFLSNVRYEDVPAKEGDFFGEATFTLRLKQQPADVVATENCFTFLINEETMEKVLGDKRQAIGRAKDRHRLKFVKLIADSDLDNRTITALTKMLVDTTFSAGTAVITEGQPTEAAIYLMYEGSVKIEFKDPSEGESRKLLLGAYFGEQLLLADANKPEGDLGPTKVIPNFTVTVLEDCHCSMLTLADCRRILDTRLLGTSILRKRYSKSTTQAVEAAIPPKELKRHKILGAGTFGQVWLTSRTSPDGSFRDAYALKIQSKFELVRERQARAVVNEKNIMSQLGHPFLLRLVASYKDSYFVYMLLDLVPGGELYSHIYDNKGRSRNMPKQNIKFYAACIAEALGYMHRRNFVYRDLKPENVMINAKGYGVIIDFGFTKFVSQKTYTLCGTPLYLAPECILSSGHNWAVDHWALGVMIFEMFTGQNPFQHRGMDQMSLFQCIVKADYTVPSSIPKAAQSIIKGFLVKDPLERLGSFEDGEDDVHNHNFFEEIDFSQLRRQEISAPHVPKMKDPLDTCNFDDWSHLEDKTRTGYPKLEPQDEALFDEF